MQVDWSPIPHISMISLFSMAMVLAYSIEFLVSLRSALLWLVLNKLISGGMAIDIATDISDVAMINSVSVVPLIFCFGILLILLTCRLASLVAFVRIYNLVVFLRGASPVLISSLVIE